MATKFSTCCLFSVCKSLSWSSLSRMAPCGCFEGENVTKFPLSFEMANKNSLFELFDSLSQPNKSLGEENSLRGRRLKAKRKGRGRGFRAREGKSREQLDVQGCLSFAYITSWRDGENNGALGKVPFLSSPSRAVSRPNSVPLSFRTLTMQATNKMEKCANHENFPNLGLSVKERVSR